MSASAEATVSLSAEGLARIMGGEALVTARVAGIMAAKRMPELIPLRAAAAALPVEIVFEPMENSIRITANGASAMEAMTGASVAALVLYDMAADSSAVIDGVRAVAQKPKIEAPRRSVAMRGERVKPQVLMGEVASPRASPDSRREAFRNFMTSKRLRPTTWARDAGVSTGEIMGFLTGRSRGFSGEVAEKLARAARVTVEDMFR